MTCRINPSTNGGQGTVCWSNHPQAHSISAGFIACLEVTGKNWVRSRSGAQQCCGLFLPNSGNSTIYRSDVPIPEPHSVAPPTTVSEIYGGSITQTFQDILSLSTYTISPSLPPQPTPVQEANPDWVTAINLRIDNDGEDYAYEWLKNRARDEGYNNAWIERQWDGAMATRKPKTNKHFLDRTLKEAFPRSKFVKVDGEVGIEIEAEGKNLAGSMLQYWQTVADHSLRAFEGHNPVEYVLRAPINRADVMPALKYLEAKLKQSKATIAMSHRCSVHVHINVQELPMKQILNYMTLYYILENVLIEWSGPERKGNLFALRAEDADFQIELLVDALKRDNWAPVFSQEYRYSAMNVTSLSKHGSLEFRSMQGNVNIEYINSWVNMLLHLKDIANSYKDPADICNRFTHVGPEKFFEEVFKGYMNVFRQVRNNPEFNRMLWDSFRAMRDLGYAVDWSNPPAHMLSKVSFSKVVPPHVLEVESDFDEDEEVG